MNDTRKGVRVIFMGPLPPPDSGISYLCRSLLDAGLGDGLRLEVLNTGKGTAREDFGKVTATDVYLAVRNALRLLKVLARFRPQIFHLVTTAGTGCHTSVSSGFGCCARTNAPAITAVDTNAMR